MSNYQKRILETPLYSKVDFNGFNLDEFLNTLFYNHKIEEFNESRGLNCYCIKCEKEVTFNAKNDESKLFVEIQNVIKDCNRNTNKIADSVCEILHRIPVIYRSYECPYDKTNTHDIVFCFKLEDYKLIKIGQYPPMIDLIKPEIEHIKDYDQDIYNELSCALNLSGQGMAIGAFIYLRRIIEKYIVLPAMDEKLNSETFEQQQIIRKSKSTFVAKFKYVKDKLPKNLAENENLFSVISRGVHSLTEEDCNKYFNTLFQTIKLIVNKKIRDIKEEEENKQLLLEINKINEDHPKH